MELLQSKILCYDYIHIKATRWEPIVSNILIYNFDQLKHYLS
jgi:hypothetical protein